MKIIMLCKYKIFNPKYIILIIFTVIFVANSNYVYSQGTFPCFYDWPNIACNIDPLNVNCSPGNCVNPGACSGLTFNQCPSQPQSCVACPPPDPSAECTGPLSGIAGVCTWSISCPPTTGIWPDNVTGDARQPCGWSGYIGLQTCCVIIPGAPPTNCTSSDPNNPGTGYCRILTAACIDPYITVSTEGCSLLSDECCIIPQAILTLTPIPPSITPVPLECCDSVSTCPPPNQSQIWTCQPSIQVPNPCPNNYGVCQSHSSQPVCCDPSIPGGTGGSICEQRPGMTNLCTWNIGTSCTTGYACNEQPIGPTVLPGNRRLDFSRLYQVIQPQGAAFTFSTSLTLGEIISSIINGYVFPFAGILLLLYLILAGLNYLLSLGEPGAIQRARSTLTNALIGFIIIFTAYWITQIIGTILGIQAVGGIFR